MISYKKGTDKILAVYWFAILVLVSAGIISMVYSFQVPYDVRAFEVEILNDQMVDCIAPGGIISSNILDYLNQTKPKSQVSESQAVKTNLDRTKEAINYAKNNVIDNNKCNCGESCDQYSEYMAQSSEKYQIQDPLLLLSIIIQESSCNPQDCSDSSCGLMQINLKEHCGKRGLPLDLEQCRNEMLNNPQKNIDVGAQILKEYYDENKNGLQFSGACKENKNKFYYGWEAALRAYNGKGCNPNYPDQDFYVERTITKFEALKSQVGPTSSNQQYSTEISSQCKINLKNEDNSISEYYLELQINDFIEKKNIYSVREGNINLKTDCVAREVKEYQKLSKCNEKEFYSIDKDNKPYLIKILSIVRKTEKNVA